MDNNRRTASSSVGDEELAILVGLGLSNSLPMETDRYGILMLLLLLLLLLLEDLERLAAAASSLTLRSIRHFNAIVGDIMLCEYNQGCE